MFGFLKSLFSGKSLKQSKIDYLIATDPELKRIEKEMQKLDQEALDRLKNDPEFVEMLKMADMDWDDLF